MDSGGGKNATPNKTKNTSIHKRTLNKEQKLKFATWNVRTMLDPTNLSSITIPRRSALIAKELRRYNIDVAALQDTHLKDTGQLEEVSEGYTFFWSGCNQEEPNYYGVAICIKTKLLRTGVVTEPTYVNDRLNGKNESEMEKMRS